jgi:hypothetical protein
VVSLTLGGAYAQPDHPGQFGFWNVPGAEINSSKMNSSELISASIGPHSDQIILGQPDFPFSFRAGPLFKPSRASQIGDNPFSRTFS